MTEPALSPEEWTVVLPGGALSFEHESGWMHFGDEETPDQTLHLTPRWQSISLADGPEKAKVSALCLHGQPFGFTWADVDALERASDPMSLVPFDYDGLAERIAALLPPRSTTGSEGA